MMGNLIISAGYIKSWGSKEQSILLASIC